MRPIKNIWINEHHDTDWDRVPNFRDCQPFNPHMQDLKQRLKKTARKAADVIGIYDASCERCNKSLTPEEIVYRQKPGDFRIPYCKKCVKEYDREQKELKKRPPKQSVSGLAHQVGLDRPVTIQHTLIRRGWKAQPKLYITVPSQLDISDLTQGELDIVAKDMFGYRYEEITTKQKQKVFEELKKIYGRT